MVRPSVIVGVCAAIAVCAAGCGARGPVTNGGLSASQLSHKGAVVVSGGHRFETGSVTLINPSLKPRRPAGGFGPQPGPGQTK